MNLFSRGGVLRCGDWRGLRFCFDWKLVAMVVMVATDWKLK
jgi:hypothetical protein